MLGIGTAQRGAGVPPTPATQRALVSAHEILPRKDPRRRSGADFLGNHLLQVVACKLSRWQAHSVKSKNPCGPTECIHSDVPVGSGNKGLKEKRKMKR